MMQMCHIYQIDHHLCIIQILYICIFYLLDLSQSESIEFKSSDSFHFLLNFSKLIFYLFSAEKFMTIMYLVTIFNLKKSSFLIECILHLGFTLMFFTKFDPA